MTRSLRHLSTVLHSSALLQSNRLRVRARLAIAGAVSIALLANGVSGARAADKPSEPETKPGPVSVRPDPVSAMSTAQAQKSRVEDESGRTESTSRFANPDGSWTVEAAAGQVRARDAKGNWVAVDPSVVQTAEGFKPRRSEVDARFSKGGDRKLAEVETTTGKTISVQSDNNLPTPAASGRELTYLNAADGNDVVVKSFAEGFNFSVVIKERPEIEGLPNDDEAPPSEESESSEESSEPASEPTMSPAAETFGIDPDAPAATSPSPDSSPTPSESPSPDASDGPEPEQVPSPEPTAVPTPQPDSEPTDEPKPVVTGGPTYSFALDTAGLTTEVSDEGTLVFKDGKKTVAAMSMPVMWDSGEGENRHIGKVELTLENGSVVLRPDPEFLADPDTVYPVTVDPSVVLNVASDTWVHSFLDHSSQIDSPELRVGSNNLGIDVARSYLNFDVSAIPSGSTVSEADVNVSNFGTGHCTGSALTMTRITGAWSPGSITWSAQPAVTTTGQTSSTASFGATACPTETTVSFDATQIVSDWVGGAANLGVRIKADVENNASGYRRFRSMDNGDPAKIPTLSVTYNSPPSVPTEPEVAPAVADDGSGFLTAATKPTFAAVVSDPDGSLVTAEFKLTKAGATVDSATLPAVPSGTRVTRKVPSDLSEGTYQAQWRTGDGTLTSAWSSPKELIVDLTAPSAPTITCTGATANEWYDTKPAATTDCTVTASSDTDSASAELNGADAGFPTLSGGSTSKTFTLPDDGIFDLHVIAHDEAGNAAEKSHTFGIGSGGLTHPGAGARSVNRFSINASSKSGATNASLQWRRAGDSWAAATQVTKDGAAWTGSTFTQGSMSRTGTLAWAAAEESGATSPSLIEARVCFAYSSGPDRCTVPTSLTLVPHAFGDAFPTAEVGPADVALQTGEFQLSETDVTAGGLSISRTYQSFDGPSSPAQSVFGPGWVAELDGPMSELAAAMVIDRSAADGTITLMVDGESTIYRHQAGTIGSQAVGLYVAQGEGATYNERLEIVAGTPKTLVLTSENGTVTTWNHISGTTWTIEKVDKSTAEPATTYSHDAAGLVTGIYDAPTGVTCDATTQDRGCHALFLSYVTVSGAKRLDKVEFRTWDPQPGSDGSPGTGAMTTTTVARYGYDSSGRLTGVWDPRLTNASGPLETTYAYQALGGDTYLASATPPGEKTWNFALDSGGRLSTVTRAQADGSPIPATWSVVYSVPLTGTNLPDMTNSGVAAWGQITAPADATAVFGPDAPGTSDYRYADITYFSRSGLVTNTAAFGAGDWQIDSLGYDNRNNVVWELSALARDMGLKANHAAAAIRIAASTLTYYSADGTRVETVMEPYRYVMLSDTGTGGTVRQVTQYVYDDEATAEGVPVPGRPTVDPNLPKQNLLVEKRVSANLSYDVRRTRYRYDKVASTDGDGWVLGIPTRVSVELGSGWSTTLARFDADGRLLESRTPQGVAGNDGPGTDSRSTLTSYFTADGSSPVGACRNRPEWVDVVCRTAPAGGNSPVQTSAGFDYLGNPTRSTETAGAVTRAAVVTYDSAGRPTKAELTVSGAPSGDQPIGETTYGYSLTTGAQTTITRGGNTASRVYDMWGRITSQTDGAGNTATTSYDAAGRVREVNDGRGVSTYTWDGIDARGQIEHRDLVTKLDVGLPSGPDEFASAYDGGGNEIERHLPGTMTTKWTYDYVGQPYSLGYYRNGVGLLGDVNYYDIHGRVAIQGTNATTRHYSYDGRDRLTQVKDDSFLDGGTCTTRTYGFSLDSNRTTLATAGPAGDGSCTAANPTTVTSTFDDRDRITDSGYTYDDLGRTRTLPAAHTLNPTAGQTTLAYHANDMVASITQGTTATTYSLDPLDRISVAEHKTAGVTLRETTDHYAAGWDTPAWTQTRTRPNGSGSWTTKWTRWVAGPDGALAIQSDSDGTSTLQLANLHGDIISTIPTTATGGLANYAENTEYGIPHSSPFATPPGKPYGWLGAHQRSNDNDPGLTLMGVRLYSPTTGRFLSGDPIRGGNDNTYVYPADPVGQFDLDGLKKKYVSVPDRYEYVKDRKKREKMFKDPTLHDYCTSSPDSFHDASFKGPCARHDLCLDKKHGGGYYNSDRSECDKKLEENMRINCRYAYKKGSQRRYQCYDVARSYFRTVTANTRGWIPGRG